jgi:hypothetical protein
MAKRKAARAAGRRKKARRAGASRSRTRAAAARKRGGARKAAARLRKASAKPARKASKAKARVRRTASARKASAGRARKAASKPARAARVAPRKAPALNRERRTIGDEGIVPTPPSSLDLDRSASAVRTGRRELHEKLAQHTETSPAITGGDIDADWESAYAVGDEAPGGDNPTPDQDIVDDIGRAVGVEYEDNEELKGEKKISDRDRKRWELDPASAEDYDER